MQQGGRQITGPLKTQSAFDEAIEAEQFGGFQQAPLAGGAVRGQRQGPATLATGNRAGEAGQMLSQPRPLQQGQGFGLDSAQAGP